MQTVIRTIISDELRRRFVHARRVLVLTGAGVSAESGVPTFRGGGNTAVWKGMPFDVISSAQMVQRDLPAVWEWFDYRREMLKALEPNPAHQAIAQWQNRFEQFTLVTQNIDGLHHRAGSRDVIELHGSIWRARCITCHAAAEQAGKCELCFVVGTSAVVYPAAAIPEIARAAGAYVCEVNPEPTPLSNLCDEVIQGRAGEVLPILGIQIAVNG